MAHQDNDKLFLLEVLVEDLYISNSSLSLDTTTKSNIKETCVMFQFLDYPPLVVCEQDFSRPENRSDINQISFKTGKSIIFAVDPSHDSFSPYTFDLNVSIIGKMEPSNNKVIIGTSLITLGDSFGALLHSCVPQSDLPLQKTKTGSFDINDKKEKRVGYLNAFVRLSCFGNIIITQFQVGMSGDEKTLMFKDGNIKQDVEMTEDCKRAPVLEDTKEKYYDPPKQLQSPYAKLADGHGLENEYPCYGDTNDLVPYNFIDDYGLNYKNPPNNPTEDIQNWKEIVAEIRGHSLHIRVPMKSKKPKDDTVCKKQLVDEIEGPVCKYAPKLNLCDCDFPVPPEAIPRCGPN